MPKTSSEQPLASPPAVSERTIVFLVGAIQFVNILDFMMVMPLGPDFAKALGVSSAHLGFIGGSYTAAAGISGLVGALFLDRFDRRKALAVAMLGLVLGTLAGGFAVNLSTLMLARVVAGAFGGPATSLSLSIIADAIPPERRGKALGAVAGAFAIASVLGVPAGLTLARHGGWRMPFFAVSLVGLLVTAGAIFLLPPMRKHLERPKGEHDATIGEILQRQVVLLSLLMTASIMMSAFIIVPNIAAYLQENLNYRREELEKLYLVGGVLSFGASRWIGRLVDRYGSFPVGSLGSALFILVIYLGFINYLPAIPVLAIFVSFMLASSVRTVPYNTLTSKVPAPRERARFLSIQSAVQHFSSSIGAFLSAQLLHELPNRHLEGIPLIAYISIGFAASIPLLLWLVETRVDDRVRRDSAAHHPRAPHAI
jgi:predicted MFS family arabinose efflux permease